MESGRLSMFFDGEWHKIGAWDMTSEPVNAVIVAQNEIVTEDYNELMKRVNEAKSIVDLHRLGRHLNKIKKTFPLVQVQFAAELYEEKLNELQS